MEGVETNYKNIECLDTLKAFDEFGFPNWHEVRPGSTNSCVGAAEVISVIFKRLPASDAYRDIMRFVRADSAYCNVPFFNACKMANAFFVTSMRDNMLEPRLGLITKWRKQNVKDPDRLLTRDGRECEIGETVYRPKDGQEALRIVCLRAEKTNLPSAPLFVEDRYDYFAFVTNIPHTEMSGREVILFYRKRGNVENFIK